MTNWLGGYIGMDKLSKNHSDIRMAVGDVGDFTMVTAVEISLTNGKGQVIKKTLRGEEARKWHSYVVRVCTFADESFCNPPWEKLKWLISKV